jgi:sulfate adenylyltransferase subunit 2
VSRTGEEHYHLSNLDMLEAESIHIIREVAAECEKPVMLYSVGKDSSVMLHLARKAFFPDPVPFPLLHVDTGFKFPEMYAFRDETARRYGLSLVVYRDEEAIAAGVNPLRDGTIACCGQLKTRALVSALAAGGYDAAFGGARRDEERSRAKERIFSFRDAFGQWDPKNQRPELWNLYNTRKNKIESFRVFPLSNWTETDVWSYIYREKIEVVPLYFAADRQVIERDGHLIPVYPGVPLLPKEKVTTVKCRFRTLGCHFCTGAVRSEAATVPAVLREMLSARFSERITRLIDHDQDSSMEQKKRDGYF